MCATRVRYVCRHAMYESVTPSLHCPARSALISAATASPLFAHACRFRTPVIAVRLPLLSMSCVSVHIKAAVITGTMRERPHVV